MILASKLPTVGPKATANHRGAILRRPFPSNTRKDNQMTDNREKMLDKIRALLSKTTENGCTEEEELASLAKARALMDAYEVTGADLQLAKDEGAILRKEPPGSRDMHGIKAAMAGAVAQFTDCRAWRDRKAGLVFCGLPADVRFATWLLDHLTAFVQAELVKHLMGDTRMNGGRRLAINGFVIGATSQITRRLTELCKPAATASVNSRALVVTKQAVIRAKMAELGIHLRKGRSSGRQYDASSLASGRSAGDRASFCRPVSGANAVPRLK
jgi:hypothetical protein